MSDYLYGGICLSDIPRELFKKAENGKVYLNIAVARRREVSTYGDTHSIIASVPREKRADGDKPIYCGYLKEHIPQVHVTTESIDSAPVADMDDLPF
jgi:hypothetical protein